MPPSSSPDKDASLSSSRSSDEIHGFKWLKPEIPVGGILCFLFTLTA